MIFLYHLVHGCRHGRGKIKELNIIKREKKDNEEQIKFTIVVLGSINFKHDITRRLPLAL